MCMKPPLCPSCAGLGVLWWCWVAVLHHIPPTNKPVRVMWLLVLHGIKGYAVIYLI